MVFHNDKMLGEHLTPSVKNEIPIGGEWSLSFPAGWGAPDTLRVKELKPWNELDVSAEAKAFSGTVTYKSSFVADEHMLSTPLMLDLGSVNMIAVVKINGKKLATLWCPPYAVDISSAVKEGENELVVEVTSTWFNRLVYDASLPENERKTWTLSGPSSNNSLRDYGLMGSVKLRY